MKRGGAQAARAVVRDVNSVDPIRNRPSGERSLPAVHQNSRAPHDRHRHPPPNHLRALMQGKWGLPTDFQERPVADSHRSPKSAGCVKMGTAYRFRRTIPSLTRIRSPKSAGCPHFLNQNRPTIHNNSCLSPSRPTITPSDREPSCGLLSPTPPPEDAPSARSDPV